jgi:hypothetical protein
MSKNVTPGSSKGLVGEPEQADGGYADRHVTSASVEPMQKLVDELKVKSDAEEGLRTDDLNKLYLARARLEIAKLKRKEEDGGLTNEERNLMSDWANNYQQNYARMVPDKPKVIERVEKFKA